MRQWVIRLTPEWDAYEIVTPTGEVEDTVAVRELVEAERGDLLLSRRAGSAMNTYRVRRFGKLLETP